MVGRVGHLNADGAQPDDAQRTARQFRTDKLLLALLHGLFERVVVTFEALHEAPSLTDVASAEEQ